MQYSAGQVMGECFSVHHFMKAGDIMPYALYEKEQSRYVSSPSPEGWALHEEPKHATKFPTKEQADEKLSEMQQSMTTTFATMFPRALKLEVKEVTD